MKTEDSAGREQPDSAAAHTDITATELVYSPEDLQTQLRRVRSFHIVLSVLVAAFSPVRLAFGYIFDDPAPKWMAWTTVLMGVFMVRAWGQLRARQLESASLSMALGFCSIALPYVYALRELFSVNGGSSQSYWWQTLDSPRGVHAGYTSRAFLTSVRRPD